MQNTQAPVGASKPECTSVRTKHTQALAQKLNQHLWSQNLLVSSVAT